MFTDPTEARDRAAEARMREAWTAAQLGRCDGCEAEAEVGLSDPAGLIGQFCGRCATEVMASAIPPDGTRTTVRLYPLDLV